MNPDDFKSALLARLGLSPAEPAPPQKGQLLAAALGRREDSPFADTLAAVLGGRPTIVDRPLAMGPKERGEYTAPNPFSAGDTILLNTVPGPDAKHPAPSRDFALSHEMGHRLYAQNTPSLDAVPQYRPRGTQDAALRPMLQQAGNSEGFAQSFAAALESLRAAAVPERHPYDEPAYNTSVSPVAVQSLRRWLLQQPQFTGWSPAPVRPDATAVRKP